MATEKWYGQNRTGRTGRAGPEAVVFEPDDTWLDESRLQVKDSLLDPDEAGRVNLVIHNPNK